MRRIQRKALEKMSDRELREAKEKVTWKSISSDIGNFLENKKRIKKEVVRRKSEKRK